MKKVTLASSTAVWLANAIIYTLVGIFVATLAAIPDGQFWPNAKAFWMTILGVN